MPRLFCLTFSVKKKNFSSTTNPSYTSYSLLISQLSQRELYDDTTSIFWDNNNMLRYFCLKWLMVSATKKNITILESGELYRI